MLYKPPDRSVVTAKTFTNQTGNKIAGKGEVLLPILLLVFSLQINPVTDGNEITGVLRLLNKSLLKCTVLHFSSEFLKGCLIYYRYFVTKLCICMYLLGKNGNKRGNKSGNGFYFVTAGSALMGVRGRSSR